MSEVESLLRKKKEKKIVKVARVLDTKADNMLRNTGKGGGKYLVMFVSV